MPIYSSNLFDFYPTGDAITVNFKGTYNNAGFTPYSLLTNAFAQMKQSLNVTAVVKAIVERWLMIEDYMLMHDLTLSKDVVKEVIRILFFPNTEEEEVVESVSSVMTTDEDDHIQFEYEF